MDNLAHALVGAALGRAVADRHVPSAAVIGGICANVPDVAEVFTGYFGWSRPEFLLNHRGITHSLLGAVVEIGVLTAIVGFLTRRDTARPPWRWVLALVGVAILSHVFMDWQGSYGWRPFLPWSGTWYYLDWVAIADPFFWLLPLIALAWGADRHWLPLSAALVTGGLILLIIVRYAGDGGTLSPWVLPTCAALAIVGAIGWIRFWFGPVRRQRAATLAVLLLALYSGAQGIALQAREHGIRAQAVHRFGPSARWAALTNVGRPFTWEAVYASPDSVVTEHWVGARNLNAPAVVRAVRETPQGHALAQFARFLTARADSTNGTVYLWDSRYARGPSGGWAAVAIKLK
jgi:inner membrane protein